MRIDRRIALTALTTAALLAGLVGSAQAQNAVGAPERADQEYVWISNWSSLPLFTERVYPALEKFAQDFNVKVRIAGPTSNDLAGFIASVETECAKGEAGPAGIIVVGGWDPALTESVNKCIAAKVPVAVTDGDLFQSDRLTYVGTDWYQLGCRMAERQIAEHQARGLTGGEVAVISPIQMENMQRSRDCIRSTLEGAGIKVVAEEDNESNAEVGAQKTAALINAYPDLTGIIGLDSEAGPGIVAAVNEATNAGTLQPNELVLTTNEAGREYLQNVKDGLISMVTMEKYDVMNYLALFMLYTFHNDAIRIAGIDPWQTNWMPRSIDSGLFLVDSTNVDQVMAFMEEAEAAGG
jgi:ABC-type sugar transport system substrate-binding protein